MLEALRERSPTDTETPERSVTVEIESDTEPLTKSTLFRLGRLLYGGILAFMAVDGLRNAEGRAQYAEAKGVPKPEIATKASHWLLLAGGIGIALWRLPSLAASAAVAFFVGVTPEMHDFWAVDDPDQKQQQTTQFLKNAALLGTALVFLGVAQHDD